MKSVSTLVIMLLLMLNASAGIQAQSSKYKNISASSLESLKEGIKSDNDGLKRSSIYMAGLYKIDEAVETLTEQLEREKDAGTRILISLSLYNIGDPDGMEAVKKLSFKDSDKEVKRMSTALYKEFADSK
jgi:HEAT repeat protein